jgi:glycerol-3-phosphate acyltransferase PlsY
VVVRAAIVTAAAYAAGAVPFSNAAARSRAGVDLRSIGDGTVSGTALYRVAGFGPLAVAGLADVGKGAIGPALATRRHPVLGALSGGVAVAAHNWSPLLGGAGGRGISPSLGALAVRHWQGSVFILAGLTTGRFARQTGLGSFVTDVALIPFLARVRGRHGALAAAAVVVPMVAKRLAGNRPPVERSARTYVHRLLFDSDPKPASHWRGESDE